MAKKQPTLMKFMDELGRVIKRKEPISKLIDFTLEEIIPEIFKDKADMAYKNNKKHVDYISRHLI